MSKHYSDLTYRIIEALGAKADSRIYFESTATRTTFEIANTELAHAGMGKYDLEFISSDLKMIKGKVKVRRTA